MMQLEFDGRRFPIGAGETTVGSDPACGIVVPADGVRPRHAVLRGEPDGTAAIRRADAVADVEVNGVRLGADPTPILHGDKVRLGAAELFAVDARRSGRTQSFEAIRLPEGLPGAARSSGTSGAVGTVNGRVVSLTDGREYRVGLQPLVFGRDAGADVVLPGNEASRQHAEIRPGPDGYQIVDSSANGTFVNGVRIEGLRTLARGDMIRLGADEFRFYAEPAALPTAPPPGAAERLSNTLIGVAFPRPTPTPVPGAAPAPPLASLLGRSGSFKGQRFVVRTPVANIGRADFNDVVFSDSSVSAQHAKLQRRDGIWIVSDVGSTNGTTVDGEPVKDEVPLGPGATIRFGEVAVLFEPLDERAASSAAAATRSLGRVDPPAGALPAEQPPPPPRPRPRRPPRPVPPPPSQGISTWLVATLVAAAAVLAYLLLT